MNTLQPEDFKGFYEIIIKNIESRIKNLEICINILSSTIDKNKENYQPNSSYSIGYDEGELEATILHKQSLQDLLKLSEETKEEELNYLKWVV